MFEMLMTKANGTLVRKVVELMSDRPSDQDGRRIIIILCGLDYSPLLGEAIRGEFEENTEHILQIHHEEAMVTAATVGFLRNDTVMNKFLAMALERAYIVEDDDCIEDVIMIPT